MKKIIQSSLILFLFSIFVFTACGQSNKNETTVIESKKTNSKKVVVLELFTSQGCSSCPSADKILASYAIQNNPNIIPLAFHVDYWNYLGWKDPFSSAAFSDKQREYANYFKSSNVYTPQIVINGNFETVGSNVSGIEANINKQLKTESLASLEITSTNILNNKLNVNWNTDAKGKNQLINFALVKKKEFTQIKRGENLGLKQTSYNIVYDYKTLKVGVSNQNEISFNFKNDWNKEDFMVVGYIQNTSNGEIETASKAEIN